jgi:vacuolar-type H+-ATPase subunit I/STV1
MRYISEDGKIFDSEEICLQHEREERERVEKERARIEKLEKEKDSRYEEILAKERELDELIKKFKQDYGSSIFSRISNPNSVQSLLNMLSMM